MRHFINLLAVFLLCGCTQKDISYISRTDFIYDTVVSIQIYDSDNQDILDTVFEMCHNYEDKFSRTINSSEISQLNHANGQSVQVSDCTIELLQLGIYYSQISDGVFDITVSALSELWNNDVIPLEKDIQMAMQSIDYNNVTIDGNIVTLDNNAQIDVGGIAKGFIADKVKQYLQSIGIKHAIINLGGNILTIGNKPDGTNFNIGIQEPFAQMGVAITTYATNDKSIVTSGIYERYFEVGGNMYHHVLDPTTGYPFVTDLYGVTIISDSSVEGDVLSTICLAKGLVEGEQFLENFEDIDALFITNNMELIYLE
ncbi:MAG: hypothetical protein BEN19_07465 [Epulopiscium sp. Nuni2H_MBin003]|nr:MAG: hypothetical protein BEN19_07465 [Epulopiscium sp. Nuni2H_MBin003]